MLESKTIQIVKVNITQQRKTKKSLGGMTVTVLATG